MDLWQDVAAQFRRLGGGVSPRRIPADALRWYGFLQWTAPVLALFLRMAEVRPFALAFVVAVGGPMVLALVIATAVVLRSRPHPIFVARRLDADRGNDLRFVSAAECATLRKRSALAGLLAARVLDEMRGLAPLRGVLQPSKLYLPQLLLVPPLIALLVLIVPAWGRFPLIPTHGSSTNAGGSGEGSDAAAGAADPDARRAEVPDIDAAIDVVVKADRATYLLGEEITLNVTVTARADLPPGTPMAIVLTLNGEHRMLMGGKHSLPLKSGESTEAEFPLQERLKILNLYKPGLVTVDTDVLAADERSFAGSAAGNRVVVEIAENVERKQTLTPQPAKQEPKPTEEPEAKKPDGGSGSSDDRTPKPLPGSGPPPPGDIDAKPFVIEPLFAGSQRSERDIRVFDRTERAAPKAPEREASGAGAGRDYERTDVLEADVPDLSRRERDIVRRYLKSLNATGGDR